jgi:hypothetical protein
MEPTDQQRPHSTMDDYRRRELEAVNDLNRLRVLSEKLRLDAALIAQIDAQLQRNKERRFGIAVVGEFKRGKSTFINALLGKEILPSDVSPCSATLNRVAYGMRPSAVISYKGEHGAPGRRVEVEIDQLAEYVTKLTPESAERAANVKEATVFYPINYCRDGVEIIDTPGLNDDEAMTSVTLAVLPEVSAAIMVIMATSPFSQYEGDFLSNQLMLQDLGRVLFVVTGIDMIRKQADRDKVLKTIKQRIGEAVDERLSAKFGRGTPEYQIYREQIGEPQVYGISGVLALEAKQDGDAELEQESGFPDFEAALEKFITETRGAVELQVLNNRIIAAANEILSKQALELGAMSMQLEEFNQAYVTAMSELEALRQQRQDEARRITEAAGRAKAAVRPLILGLEERLKRSAEETIDGAQMRGDELTSSEFVEKFGKKIAAAVQNTAKRVSEDVQLEVEKHLVAEVNRLGGFAAQISQTLSSIELQFVKSGAGEPSRAGRTVINTIAGGLSGGLGGGILAGYERGGVGGAAVGGAAGVTAAVAGGMALLAVGIPLTFPALIVLGVVSTFAGDGLTKRLFENKRIESFKREYKEHVFQQIDAQFRLQRLDLDAEVQIERAFEALKEKVIGEAEAIIEQQRSTLDQLRARKTAQETLTDHMRREAEAMGAEVQQIRARSEEESRRIAAMITATIEPKE